MHACLLIDLLRVNPEYSSFHVAPQHFSVTHSMILVAIAWMYVALMMAVAEATNSNGTLLGAIFTFLIYGLGPLSLVVYIMGVPARKKARKAREHAAWEAQREVERAAASGAPDGGGEAAADAVAAVRKKS
jgi:hypothetical protein